MPLEIWLVAPTLICEDARHVVEIAQGALDTMNTFPPQPIRMRLAKSRPIKDRKGQPFAEEPDCFLKEYDAQSTRPALKLHLVPDEEFADIKLTFDPQSARADLVYGEVSTRALGSYAASTIYSIFADERAILAHKFAAYGASSAVDSHIDPVPEHIQSDVKSRENRALKYASTYHLTFSLFTPGGSPTSWAIESALETYVQPWVSAFATISNFSINTQIQPYSAYSPSIQPFRDSNTDHSLLRHEDLSAFINAAEWPLSPSIGSHGPTINFVL
jgi:GPI-anchor transamidase subunit S